MRMPPSTPNVLAAGVSIGLGFALWVEGGRWWPSALIAAVLLVMAYYVEREEW